MQSKAAFGTHPIHPMLVPIPIGAFVVALVGDVMFAVHPERRLGYDLSFTAMAIGLAFALAAAVFGAIDYFGVRMSSRAFRTATWHAGINLLMVALYAASFLLRRHDAAMAPARWPVAMGLALAGFGLLAVAGWLGGKLAYEHRVGVIERPSAVGRGTMRERAAS
jgi:uncharacterized membrane protein